MANNNHKNNQMTPTQRNYAIQRVDDIVRTKDQAIRKTCLRQEPRSITYAELVKLVKKGVIKVKKGSERDHYQGYTNVSNVFDVEAATDYYRPHATYDEAAYEKKMKAIRIEAQEINDKLMLGDAGEALKMVNDFKKKLK